MTDLADDIAVKVATAAAQDFVESYYPALNNPNGHRSLPTFYVKPTASSPTKPDISLNGNILSDPAGLQNLFDHEISRAHYEVQDYDVHPVNPNYNIGVDESGLAFDKDGKKMSVIVIVSGSVKYWKEGEEGEPRGFTESVVLVPNREAYRAKAAKGEKKWLILSQNFRLVL